MEARVDLTLNNAQFLSGMQQADRAGKQFAGGWESSIGSIFKRSPFARAERALTEFALQLSSGNVPGAVAALGSRITGLGLAVGVGIGAAVLVVQKFVQQLTAADAASQKLKVNLASSNVVRSPEATGQKADSALADTLDTLKQSQGFASKFRNFFSDITGGTADIDQQYIILRGLEQVGNLLQNQVRVRERLEIIGNLESRGLKEQAGIEKILLESAIEKGKIEEEAISRRATLQAKISETKDPNEKTALAGLMAVTRQTEAAEKTSIDRLTQYRIAAAQIPSQRSIFQKSVEGFNPRSAAITEGFLRDKIASDPNAPGIKQLQLQADQVKLFRQNAELDEMKGIDFRSSPHDTAGHVFQANLRQKIDAQQQAVSDQTKKVFGEQTDVGSKAVVDAITGLALKMDEYWK